jgi:hypothetical protein
MAGVEAPLMTAWQTRERGERGERRRGAGGAPGGGGMGVAAPCSFALLLPLRAGREKKVTWGRKEREERERKEKKRKGKK